MSVNALNYLSQAGSNRNNKANIYGTVNINGTEFTAAELLSALQGTTTFANKTGGTLTAGTLVYISGYDTTLGAPTIAKADADDATKQATHIVLADIANDASGYADGQATITGLDTSSFSAVGSPVYESTTAGEFTATAPTAADDTRRQVGVVKVKDATVGSIYFYPGLGGLEQAAVYLNNLTPGTVTASGAVVVDSNKDIGDFRNLDAVNLDAGASGTAGSVDVFPATASKGKISLVAANNTNNDTLTITNAAHGQATSATIPDSGLATSYFLQSTAAITVAEADVLDGAVAGTPTASKAVVADSNINLGGVKATSLAVGVSGSEVVIGSSPAEIDLQCDISLQTETIAEGGAVSITKRITKIVSTGAGAVTLAAPDATMLGQVKIIEMTGGEHDITLALTNVQGQSSGTTATFSDINDTLVLVGGTNKWTVVGEAGIVLS